MPRTGEDFVIRLTAISEKSKNMNDLTKKIANDMKTKVDFCFRLQKDSNGNPWIKSKRAIKDNGKTLQSKGQLKNSISVRNDDTSATVGTNLKYAKTMQFGAKKHSFGYAVANVKAFTRKNGQKVKAHQRYVILPWGNIPARPFLGLSNSQKATYLKWLKEFFEETN